MMTYRNPRPGDRVRSKQILQRIQDPRRLPPPASHKAGDFVSPKGL